MFDDYWAEVEAYSPRLIESLLLQADDKERLLHDLERFKSARQRYRQLGIPYHRGYLFYGPPGTGKTSLVSALAAHFSMSIYGLNLSEMNDRSLKHAMNQVPENALVLFEDIDGMTPAQSRLGEAPGAGKANQPVSGMGVTLSGLLNVLDGFHAPEGVVYVMTTNHVEKLDAALLRPGRIDYRLYLGCATLSQKVELYRRFFPLATEWEGREFSRKHEAETMAEFQGLLLALEQEESFEPVLVRR